MALAPVSPTPAGSGWGFAEVGDDGKAGTAVGYGRLSDNLQHLEHFQVVFRQQPKLSTGNHFGGRRCLMGKGIYSSAQAK